jgi:hypothetical protein
VHPVNLVVSALPWGEALLNLASYASGGAAPGAAQNQLNGVATACAACADKGIAAVMQAQIDRRSGRVLMCGGWKP